MKKTLLISLFTLTYLLGKAQVDFFDSVRLQQQYKDSVRAIFKTVLFRMSKVPFRAHLNSSHITPLSQDTLVKFSRYIYKDEVFPDTYIVEVVDVYSSYNSRLRYLLSGNKLLLVNVQTPYSYKQEGTYLNGMYYFKGPEYIPDMETGYNPSYLASEGEMLITQTKLSKKAADSIKIVKRVNRIDSDRSLYSISCSDTAHDPERGRFIFHKLTVFKHSSTIRKIILEVNTTDPNCDMISSTFHYYDDKVISVVKSQRCDRDTSSVKILFDEDQPILTEGKVSDVEEYLSSAYSILKDINLICRKQHSYLKNQTLKKKL